MSSSNSTPKTWLITGCSSGFGLLLARTVLRHGDNVIATSRNPSRTPELVKEIESSSSGKGKWLALDVCWSASQIQSTISEARSVFGRLDIVVNNVGYSVLGPAEEIPEDRAKAQFEANFWGTLRVTQAVLPILRSQWSGTVVNVTSVAGFAPLPSAGIYAASKFALEGWSESLAQEVAQHNIRVLIVEPGAFRTNFLASGALDTVAPSEAYQTGPVAATLKKFDEMDGNQGGDPVKATQRIFEVVSRGIAKEDLGKIEKLRLLLGKDCFDRVQTRMKQMSENFASGEKDAMGLEVDK